MVSVSDVQDVNDNPPMFEQNEYTVKVVESTPNTSQVCIYFRRKKSSTREVTWCGCCRDRNEQITYESLDMCSVSEKSFKKKLPSCHLSNKILFMAICKRVNCTVTNEQREIIITAIL